MQASSTATLLTIASGTPFTQRGFTDHEHIDEAQLIHMNGRVYDYNFGRFLSVDPFIQAPGNSQSLNPYSYIMNNPLAGTDPSGYIAKCMLSIHCDTDESINGVRIISRPQDYAQLSSNGNEQQAPVTNNQKEASEIGSQNDSTNQSQSAQNQTVEHGLFSQIGHTVLGVLGAVPVVGGAADAIDTAWYAAQGDMVGASLSGASTVLSAAPGADQVAAGAKITHVLGVAKAGEAATQIIRQGKHLTLTNKQARAQASSLGFKPVKDIPKSIQKHTGKNPVFYDKSTKSYFSPDKAGHRADNAWKMFDRDGNRQTGIFDSKGVFQRVSD